MLTAEHGAREPDEHSTSLWSRHGGVVIVFIAALLVSGGLAHQAPRTYDGGIMAQVAVSMVDHGTPLVHPIDTFGLNTPYSGYGIGTSVVMAAFYEMSSVLGGDAMGGLGLADPFLFAATVAAVFVLLRRRGFPPTVVMVVTLVVAFATPLFAYALSDYSEPGVALMVALGLIGLDLAEKGGRRGGLLVGVAIGGAALFRTDSWFLIGVPMLVALWVLTRRQWRPVVSALITLVPFALVGAAYDAARFGSPLSTGYQLQPFSHPFWQGLYGLALSPGRGVFVYVPILVLALAVLPLQVGSSRVLGLLALALLVLRLVFFARWWSWYGGASWGPRFMVPVLPAFAPLVAAAVVRWRRTPIPYVAIGASLVLSITGVLVATGHHELAYAEPPLDSSALAVPMADGTDGLANRLMREWTSPPFVHATDAVMFDWSRFLDSLR